MLNICLGSKVDGKSSPNLLAAIRFVIRLKMQFSFNNAARGWVWDTLEFKWKQRFKYLEQYVTEKGDLLVHRHYKTPDGYNNCW
jgi:hypothetical protein